MGKLSGSRTGRTPGSVVEEWLARRAKLIDRVVPEVKRNLREQAKKSAKAFRRGRKIDEKLVPKGTMVMLRALTKENKLSEEYVGLFRVVGSGRREGTYVLENRFGDLFPHDVLRERIKVTTREGFGDDAEVAEVERVPGLPRASDHTRVLEPPRLTCVDTGRAQAGSGS